MTQLKSCRHFGNVRFSTQPKALLVAIRTHTAAHCWPGNLSEICYVWSYFTATEFGLTKQWVLAKSLALCRRSLVETSGGEWKSRPDEHFQWFLITAGLSNRHLARWFVHALITVGLISFLPWALAAASTGKINKTFSFIALLDDAIYDYESSGSFWRLLNEEENSVWVASRAAMF